MLVYPQIDPVAFRLGSLAVHWYGLMYLIGFLAAWIVLSLRIKKATIKPVLSVEELSDALFYCALGIILGGRIGYMLFYDWNTLIENPLRIFEIWKGGMSFHGGLIGVIVALLIYTQKTKKAFIDIADFVVPAVPLGLAAGRIGNFINAELLGRVTDVPWAMVFPNAGDAPRHPSQLYEFLLEGVVLFIILWLYSRKPRPRWAVSGMFLLCYGVIRFVLEFFREPDIQIGFVAFGWLTKGQLLSLPMIIAGISMLWWAKRVKSKVL